MTTLADSTHSDRLAEPAGKVRDAQGRGIASDLRLSRSGLGWVMLIAGLYVLLSHQPIYHTDVWGHLAYGRWIVEQGRLPQTEPLLPLSADVPMVDTAWLSQVIGYVIYDRLGVSGLQFLYAAPITLAFGLLLWGVLRKSRNSAPAGLIAVATLGWVNYQQLLIVRPQLNGLLMFVALLVLMNVCHWRRALWGVVPLMFALWAQLHGSWIVGLGLLLAMAGGQAIDILRRSRRLPAALASRTVRRLLILSLLSAAAVLINPYGGRLYSAIFTISGNPNLQSLIEWEPLTLRMSQGRAAGAIVLALMFAYRLSPRRVSATEVLLLTGLGIAALWSSRMLHWWAPVAAYYLALHSGAIWHNWHRRRAGGRVRSEADGPAQLSRGLRARSGWMSLAAIAVVCAAMLSTPPGITLLWGPPDDPEERARQLAGSTSPQTPLAATAYLHEHPPEGLVFGTYEWGDFLLFAGPRDLQLMINSHAHLIPPAVWGDALNIRGAGPGWQDRLDRYGVNTVILNRHTSRHLARALQQASDRWELVYEDRLAMIFRRREGR